MRSEIVVKSGDEFEGNDPEIDYLRDIIVQFQHQARGLRHDAVGAAAKYKTERSLRLRDQGKLVEARAELQRRIDAAWREAAIDVLESGMGYATPNEASNMLNPGFDLSHLDPNKPFEDMTNEELGEWLDASMNDYLHEIMDHSEGRIAGLSEALELLGGCVTASTE